MVPASKSRRLLFRWQPTRFAREQHAVRASDLPTGRATAEPAARPRLRRALPAAPRRCQRGSHVPLAELEQGGALTFLGFGHQAYRHHAAERMSSLDRFRRQPPGSVLVIATRQIGDVLLTTPLIRSTRLLWPGTAIDVLGFSETLGMIQGNPDIRRLIGAPSHGGAISILRFALAQKLWRAYDLVLVTTHSDRAHLLGFVAARVRSGIVPAASRSLWWKRALLSHRVTLAGDRGDVHVIDEKLALLAPWLEASEHDEEPVHAAGVTNSVACSERAQRDVVAPANSFSEISAQVSLRPGSLRQSSPSACPTAHRGRARAARSVRRGSRPFDVAIQAMALGELCRTGQRARDGWHAGRVDRWRISGRHREGPPGRAGDRRSQVPVDDVERLIDDPAGRTPSAEQRASARGTVVNLCGVLDFGQVTALLKRAALYVGPDTSVTHLAAAIGTSTIGLFGPTNPVRWGPRGPSSRIDALSGPDEGARPGLLHQPWQRVAPSQSRGNVLLLQGTGKSSSCVPCGRAGCDDHRHSRSACLESIRAERVIDAAREVLFEQS